jgi:hypothetical protein
MHIASQILTFDFGSCSSPHWRCYVTVGIITKPSFSDEKKPELSDTLVTEGF